MSYQEAAKVKQGKKRASYYQDTLKESAEFRKEYKKRKGIVKATEMPWEETPQGHLKHVVNQKMNTRECALDLYQQLLNPGGCSGKHRHLAEEVFFVLEGKGYDLHWDVKFELTEKYNWDWEIEPKRYEWEEGDFVYIPPYTTHQHFNADPAQPARFITATSRMLKPLGLDWIEQVEAAPDFQAQVKQAKKKGVKTSVKKKTVRRKK